MVSLLIGAASSTASMGLKNYLKASKKGSGNGIKSDGALPAMTEKSHGTPTFEEPTPGSLPWGSHGHGSSVSLTPSMATNSARHTITEELRQEVMVNHLFQQQCSARWLGDGAGEREGVLLRRNKTGYLASPPDLVHSTFAQGCMALNVVCAMTVNSRVIKTFLAWSPDAVDVPLKNGLRVQVIPTIEDLPRVRKLQFAAFIAQDGLLVVWDDGEFGLHEDDVRWKLIQSDPSNLLARAKAIESELIDLVWKAGEAVTEEGESSDEKKVPRVTAFAVDEESGETVPAERPTHLMNTILVAVTL